MNKLGSLVLSAALIGLPASGAWAYQGGDVKDGGSISGTVKFKGTAPTPKKIDANKDKEVCGKTQKVDESLLVNNGNLVNAVVTITDIKTGKKMDVKKVTLDQKGCEYIPHVLAFPVGSSVDINNDDGILHNIHAYDSKKNSLFNEAQPKFKKTITKKIDTAGPMNVKCDVHGWMDGWFVGADNPYYGVTEKDGGFKLTDVPPGTYTVQVWHEKLGTSTQKVTVKAKEDAKANFELASK
jgi:plastocyanin